MADRDPFPDPFGRGDTRHIFSVIDHKSYVSPGELPSLEFETVEWLHKVNPRGVILRLEGSKIEEVDLRGFDWEPKI